MQLYIHALLQFVLIDCGFVCVSYSYTEVFVNIVNMLIYLYNIVYIEITKLKFIVLLLNKFQIFIPSLRKRISFLCFLYKKRD